MLFQGGAWAQATAIRLRFAAPPPRHKQASMLTGMRSTGFCTARRPSVRSHSGRGILLGRRCYVRRWTINITSAPNTADFPMGQLNTTGPPLPHRGRRLQAAAQAIAGPGLCGCAFWPALRRNCRTPRPRCSISAWERLVVGYCPAFFLNHPYF